ncbi:unnamed protein product [Adineta ricciae]|uniref:G-protein coupled receptors family 1 profile domain-containing protein n=1 Tax=Adineta ricciae TaxID=249248 RepID=A0A814VDF6_ADIRI|nr:unnamed protein product [Adineta ricciae]
MSSSSYILFLNYLGNQIVIYVGICVVVAGILGESLNIIVFLSLRTFRQNSCAFYLTIMSTVNICQLLSSLFNRVIPTKLDIDWSKTSVFYSVIDQYLATCASLHWQRWADIRVAHRLTAVNILIWILYNIPILVYYNYIVSNTNQQAICVITDRIFIQFNNYANRFLVGKFLPICITCIFGVLALYNVKNIARRALPVARRALEKQLTIMVLLQAVVMLFTNIPYIITYLLQASLDLTGYPVISAQVQFALSVTMSVLYMSFATSFYIYCWASNRFRRQLKYVLFDIHFNRCRERTIRTNQIVPVVA